MYFHNFNWLVLYAIPLLWIMASSVNATERILSFDSNIVIAADASMTVTETIRVKAEGKDIRRGIYRDFPTRYKDRLGNRFVVDFEVLKVSRDGRAESWFSEQRTNGVRVYAGDAQTFLRPGEYSYAIVYRTSRQIGFFADHDELYWNVTGNDWKFAIDSASARVALPGKVAADDIVIKGYTGYLGQAGQDYTATTTASSAGIQTTRPLARQAGLTLVMGWPKGVVTEPTALQRFGYLLSDNFSLLLASIALVAVSAHLYLTWSRYGRDRKPGVLFPHYNPPRGYSPASARYISRMGYDNKVMAAAVINLAVKGHLSITYNNSAYVLEKKSASTKLAPGEEVLLRNLFYQGPVLKLENTSNTYMRTAMLAHEAALKRDYFNVYFTKNTGLIAPSVVVLVIMLILVALFDTFTPLVWLTSFIIVAVIAWFTYLMRAPTPKGRLLLEELDGFKLYLQVAEKDDLHLQHPPEKTPELFERYLPFAIALDVEQPWAEQFSAIFAGLGSRQGVSYHPSWYHGDFNYRNLDRFSRDVGSRLTSEITTATTAPGSTSGFGDGGYSGGGFSGGGGGGGGGGGW